MGAEIRQRDKLRLLIASSPVWQQWTGLSAAESASRIIWPDYPNESLPACVLVLGQSTRSTQPSQQGQASSYKANGQITAMFFDAVDVAAIEAASGDADMLVAARMAEDSRFGGLMTDVVDDCLARVGPTAQRIKSVSFDPVPWRRSEINAVYENPEDEAIAEIEAHFTGAYWQGSAHFQWGAF